MEVLTRDRNAPGAFSLLEKWRNNLGSEDEKWLTLLCNIQARRARRVIKKLEAGKPISCNRGNLFNLN